MQLVVFTLGRDRYALPVERVREVIRHRVPAAGVISLRDRLVPVRDIAARVGAGSLAGTEPRIVIVDLRGVAAGVMVDAVESVRDAPDGEVAPVPAEVDTGLLRCIAWVDGVLVPVLDAERVLADLLAPAAEPPAKPAAKRRAKAKPAAAKGQPSRKRSEKATRSTGGADTGSPSRVTE